jgi:microcystin-dependent protein
MAEPFLAQIMQVGFNFAPVNWAIAGGQNLPISQNSALFALIGTTFGGNGTTTFQLPNLQSRIAVGVGQSAGLSPYVWGQQGGMEQVTLNVSQMPMHTHVATLTPPTGALSALTGVNTGTLLSTPAANSKLSNTFDNEAGQTHPQIYAPANATGTAVNLAGVTLSGGSVTNAMTGGNLPTPVLQPYLALYSIIALYGVFPTRG